MTLVGIFGDVGSGKTLFSTYIVLKDDRPVYCNYDIKIDRFKSLTPSVLDRINEPSLVVIDEAYTWLESRISSSLVNRFFTHELFQMRKKRIDMVITAQLVSTVDVRFREMVDISIIAEKKEEGFVYTVFKPGRDRPSMRFLISNELAEQIFPYYDTYQRITSIDSYLIAEVEQDPDELNRIVDDLLDKLVKETQGRMVKKQYIEDFCLRNAYPSKYAKFIYNRMVSSS